MNQRILWCNVIAIFLNLGLARGQVVTSDFPILKGPYIGQQIPGDTAAVFAPGIVTTAHHEHSRLQFSMDGTEAFWNVIPIDTRYKTTGGSPFRIDQQKMWHSKIVDGRWTKPAVLGITSDNGGRSPAFSASGKYFYFISAVPDADPNVRPKPARLWKVPYNKGKWGVPEQKGDLLPDQEGTAVMSFCFAENDNLYFDFGGPDETGEWWWYIYFSEFQDDGYSAPVKMGGGVNDGEASWCPWVAPDESYIIYSSHRDGEYGRGDLYINFMDEKGNWSDPVNMGPRVNTEMQERFPSVSPDGKFLFFTRHLPETYSDMFWVDARIIEDLKRLAK